MCGRIASRLVGGQIVPSTQHQGCAVVGEWHRSRIEMHVSPGRCRGICEGQTPSRQVAQTRRIRFDLDAFGALTDDDVAALFCQDHDSSHLVVVSDLYQVLCHHAIMAPQTSGHASDSAVMPNVAVSSEVLLRNAKVRKRSLALGLTEPLHGVLAAVNVVLLPCESPGLHLRDHDPRWVVLL